MIAVPVSLLLIFILLYFAFNSVKQGLLIYSASTCNWRYFLLALRGMPLASVQVGFIALFGVAVLNGLVLIAEFNSIRKSGETDLKAIVLQGTKFVYAQFNDCICCLIRIFTDGIKQRSGAEVQNHCNCCDLDYWWPHS
jgi:cobalt-zinc-cadmium resistance protein CzcA